MEYSIKEPLYDPQNLHKEPELDKSGRKGPDPRNLYWLNFSYYMEIMRAWQPLTKEREDTFYERSHCYFIKYKNGFEKFNSYLESLQSTEFQIILTKSYWFIIVLWL